VAALPEPIRADLSERRLLPVRPAPPAQPTPLGWDRRRESARGALLGTAIGDALGRPAEGHRPEVLRHRAEELREFQPWPGYWTGPVGTVTDDTQLTMCVASSILATGGRVDPDDLARRFVEWLPVGRGKGRTCVEAVVALGAGVPWWRSGRHSAGNGAAMRTAPIGIALGPDVRALCEDAALSAVVTHADPMAVAAAIGHAWLVARLAALAPDSVGPTELVEELAAAVSVIDDGGAPERDWRHRPGKTGTPVRLADRLREVPGLLAADVEDVFAYLYNGAFVLETLPAALWCFLRHLDEPTDGVLTAVRRGHDADTVASMAAAYLGALHGPGAFPETWTGAQLEFRSELLDLADRLVGPDPAGPGSTGPDGGGRVRDGR
jgi:ADP-ribosylglycohydrolase